MHLTWHSFGYFNVNNIEISYFISPNDLSNVLKDAILSVYELVSDSIGDVYIFLLIGTK